MQLTSITCTITYMHVNKVDFTRKLAIKVEDARTQLNFTKPDIEVGYV